jgi:hypothetical protein
MIGKIASVALVLGLLCVPSVSAFVNVANEYRTQISDTSMDKPDLTITDIRYGPYGDTGQIWVISTAVYNIGNATAKGEIYITYTIRRLPSFFPVRADTVGGYEPGLIPGSGLFYLLEDASNLPKFGFFRVICEVNPDHIIEETNYENNRVTQNFLVLFGFWLPLS